MLNMNQYGYANTKPDLLKRLSRAEGQVRGISRMVDEDEYCIDILTQITAAQAALDKVALELLREHAAHCLAKGTVGPIGTDNKADELVNAISRMIKR